MSSTMVLSAALCLAAGLGDDPAPGLETQGAARDPLSRYPRNGCVSCHSSLAGKLNQVVVDWSRSVHFENSVACESCHGGDAEVLGSPGDQAAADAAHHSTRGFVERPQPAGKVSYFCGKCHVAIMEKHLGSPHGENTHPTCIFCHDHHAVRSPSTAIIDVQRCTFCHDFKTAERIKSILDDTEAQIRTLAEQAAWLEKHGYKNLALEEMHHHSQETITQLRIAFHSFNLLDISNFGNQIGTVAERTSRTVEHIQKKTEAARLQSWIGLGVTAYLVVFSVFLMLYKRGFLDAARNRRGGHGLPE